jgi:hypothetical protein
MLDERWSEVYRLVKDVAAERPRGSRRFADAVIVLTLLWAASNHKPISWACKRGHWPVWMQRILPRVPTSTTMSRRLRRESVRAFVVRMLEHAQGDLGRSLVAMLDATALEIRPHSTDAQAGYGHTSGRGRMGKGYKLHVLLDLSGKLLDWRVAPMNVGEQPMAKRMLLKTDSLAYTLGDSGYHSNALASIVAARGGQLVAPRTLPGTGLAHRRQHPARLRCLELTEGASTLREPLHRARKAVERFFAHADSYDAGLGELPPWVRTMKRVQTWVLAKLVLNAVRQRLLRKAG